MFSRYIFRLFNESKDANLISCVDAPYEYQRNIKNETYHSVITYLKSFHMKAISYAIIKVKIRYN